MFKYVFFCLCFALVVGCNNIKHDTKKKAPPEIANHFPNVIQVKQFGDSVRLEIEKEGDVLLKYFIDLKGTSDDGFDDSYTATCTYNRRNVDSSVVVNRKKVKIIALLIENYTTEFSGGKNYYVITPENDTLQTGHMMDYIQ